MQSVRGLFATVSSISKDNCKTAGLVTSVMAFALIKYALDRRRRRAPGTIGHRLFSPTATAAKRQANGRVVEYVSARQRADVRSLLTIRDRNRVVVSFESGARNTRVRFKFDFIFGTNVRVRLSYMFVLLHITRIAQTNIL